MLTGADAYPGAAGAIVADPEVAYVGGIVSPVVLELRVQRHELRDRRRDFGIAHATSTDGDSLDAVEAPVRSLLRASADTKTRRRAADA